MIILDYILQLTVAIKLSQNFRNYTALLSRIYFCFFCLSSTQCSIIHLTTGLHAKIASYPRDALTFGHASGIIAPLWKLRGRARSQFAACQLYLRIGTGARRNLFSSLALPQVDRNTKRENERLANDSIFIRSAPGARFQTIEHSFRWLRELEENWRKLRMICPNVSVVIPFLEPWEK